MWAGMDREENASST
uniref:Uncharacterized protein n=1 Tax=Arundo donax TaxID=35708 RepID=A0A0A9HBA8_ARUDO